MIIEVKKLGELTCIIHWPVLSDEWMSKRWAKDGIGDSSITPEKCLIGADSGLKGALLIPEMRCSYMLPCRFLRSIDTAPEGLGGSAKIPKNSQRIFTLEASESKLTNEGFLQPHSSRLKINGQGVLCYSRKGAIFGELWWCFWSEGQVVRRAEDDARLCGHQDWEFLVLACICGLVVEVSPKMDASPRFFSLEFGGSVYMYPPEI